MPEELKIPTCPTLEGQVYCPHCGAGHGDWSPNFKSECDDVEGD